MANGIDMKLSPAQFKLVSRMKAGGRVFFDQRTGLYCIEECGSVGKLDQRPVEALMLAGVLRQAVHGDCYIDTDHAEVPVPIFSAGQEVRWVRGEKKGNIWATVLRASHKQVRIRTGAGREHEVRPTALSAITS